MKLSKFHGGLLQSYFHGQYLGQLLTNKLRGIRSGDGSFVQIEVTFVNDIHLHRHPSTSRSLDGFRRVGSKLFQALTFEPLVD